MIGEYMLARALVKGATGGPNAQKPKRGMDIFGEHHSYPVSWAGYIGQERAKTQLKVAVASARSRNARCDHILIESGTPGIGKTALAKLTASYLGAGMSEASGTVTLKDIAAVIRLMEDGDVLFIDEIHRLVANGKKNAEWLLDLLADGVLMTPTGAVKCPDITVIGATTDGQRLPATIRSRFLVKPQLVDYSEDEATEIASQMAHGLGFGGELPWPESDEWLRQVVRASNHNPREGRSLLVTIRDLAHASGSMNFQNGTYDLGVPLDWTGITPDGLNKLAQRYLLVLASVYGGTAGERAMMSTMSEPGGVRQTEQLLTAKGLLAYGPKGRTLTDAGWARVEALSQDLTSEEQP